MAVPGALATLLKLAKNGKLLADALATFDKLSPEGRARAQAWATDLLKQRSLEERAARTVALADDLAPGAASPEQEEASRRYAQQARTLQQALAVANALKGRERQRQRAGIKKRVDELQSEMVAFLLQRSTPA